MNRKKYYMIIILTLCLAICSSCGKSDGKSAEIKENANVDTAKEKNEKTNEDISKEKNENDIDFDMLKTYVLQLYNTASLKQALVETQDILKFNEFMYQYENKDSVFSTMESKNVNSVEDLPNSVNSVYCVDGDGFYKTIFGEKFQSVHFIKNKADDISIFFEGRVETDFVRLEESYNNICKIISDHYGEPARSVEEPADPSFSISYDKIWESTELGTIEIAYNVNDDEKYAGIKMIFN